MFEVFAAFGRIGKYATLHEASLVAAVYAATIWCEGKIVPPEF